MDTLTLLLLFNILTTTADGISTDWRHDMTINGVRYHSKEIGPAKYFLGEDPDYLIMIPWGIIEVVGVTYTSKWLRKKRKSYWWVPQMSVSVAHGFCAGINFHTTIKNYGW
jgi:hypothetical protein